MLNLQETTLSFFLEVATETNLQAGIHSSLSPTLHGCVSKFDWIRAREGIEVEVEGTPGLVSSFEVVDIIKVYTWVYTNVNAFSNVLSSERVKFMILVLFLVTVTRD
ncbi:hypothetical protein ABKN59_007106 [Abortiporus biennis]